MTARRTVLPPEEDDLQVPPMPLVLGEERLEIGLGALDGRPRRQPPALGQPMDVRVDREGRHAEGLHHQHRRRLVPDPRQRLERLEAARHLAAVALDDEAPHLLEVPRLGRRQADLADQLADHFDLERRHRGRRRGDLEQRRRHLVHLLVGGLRREQHRTQERERVLVVERDLRLGV